MVTTRGPIGLYLSGIDVISDGLGGNPENPRRLHCSIKQNCFQIYCKIHLQLIKLMYATKEKSLIIDKISQNLKIDPKKVKNILKHR